MDFVITRHCSQSDILESGATIGLFDLPLPRHRNLFTPCIQQFATSLPPLLWQYVWKSSTLGINKASSDPVIWSYVVVQSDLEWIEFRWMYFKWFEFWQLQFMWFEFKQCSSKVVQNRAMWIQVRVVLPSDPQVGGHTSWLSGHCPLLELTCNQATVPAAKPFLRFWRHMSLVMATLAGTGHGQSGASLRKTSPNSFTIHW